jgi:hypothetical protein
MSVFCRSTRSQVVPSEVVCFLKKCLIIRGLTVTQKGAIWRRMSLEVQGIIERRRVALALAAGRARAAAGAALTEAQGAAKAARTAEDAERVRALFAVAAERLHVAEQEEARLGRYR